MDRRAWRAAVREVTEMWTRLSDEHFHFQPGSEVCTLQNRVSGPLGTAETHVGQTFQTAGKEEARVAEFLRRLHSQGLTDLPQLPGSEHFWLCGSSILHRNCFATQKQG